MKDCYVGYAMDIIGGKWKLLIIWTIFQNKVIRFNELQRKIDGISSLMLSKNLKELEDEASKLREIYRKF